MTNLEEQLLQSWAAKAQVDAQAELERQAAQLPMLQRQQAEQRWIAQAQPVAEESERLARQQVAEMTERMTAWRTEFAEHVQQLEALIAKLPGLYVEIDLAAQHAINASNTKQKIAALIGGRPEPMHVQRFNNFAELWVAIGGEGAGLAPLPPRDTQGRAVFDLLSKRRITLYYPKQLLSRYHDKV